MLRFTSGTYLFALAIMIFANDVTSTAVRTTLVVGLNPALQRSISLPGLVVGAVNRGSSVEIGIGGKGQNVFVAAAKMGADPSPTLVQFLGTGAEGDTVLGLLGNVQKGHVDTHFSIRTAARCRTCVTLVDSNSGEATEIIEPSGAIEAEEQERLIWRLKTSFESEKAGGVAIMGTMPPGCPPSLYASIIENAVDIDSKVLFDTPIGVFEALDVCSRLQCDSILKLNAVELCKLAGVPAHGGAEASEATPSPTIETACDKLTKILSKRKDVTTSEKSADVYVAVTDGPYPARVISLTSGRKWTYKSPPLPRPLLNPIGAGDAVSSGTLMNWCGAYKTTGSTI